MATRALSRPRRVAEPRCAGEAADEAWLETRRRATASDLLDELGINPTTAEQSVRLSEAVLDLAAHPARLGLNPVDAHQALRLLYAS